MKSQKMNGMKLHVTSFLLVIVGLSQTCTPLFRSASVKNAYTNPVTCFCSDSTGKKECPGETKCEAWQYASCKCVGHVCVGECISESTNGYDLTISVLRNITSDKLSKSILIEKKGVYLPILDRLLNSNIEGIHVINYKETIFRFSFSKRAVSLLNETRNKLECCS